MTKHSRGVEVKFKNLLVLAMILMVFIPTVSSLTTDEKLNKLKDNALTIQNLSELANSTANRALEGVSSLLDIVGQIPDDVNNQTTTQIKALKSEMEGKITGLTDRIAILEQKKPAEDPRVADLIKKIAAQEKRIAALEVAKNNSVQTASQVTTALPQQWVVRIGGNNQYPSYTSMFPHPGGVWVGNFRVA